MRKDWIKEMRLLVDGQFLADEPLKKHTSFRIGGPAELLFIPKGVDELIKAIEFLDKNGIRRYVIGAGTNILVSDKGLKGCVIKTVNALRGIKVIKKEKQRVQLSVMSGETLRRLNEFAIKNGYIGTEFCFGIPGSVGGAIAGNAGTRLGEMSDIVEDVILIREMGEIQRISKDKLGFSYRECQLPEDSVILSADIVLRDGGKDVSIKSSQELKEYRKKTQPYGFPSAGSIFKNPKEDSAGRLIELAGLKGLRLNDAEISKIHANFIINRGKADAKSVIKLIDIARSEVQKLFGIRLELEIRLLGEF
ncbi:MAG: UDP-N-acetylmuramate dehydrogenase [Deltaproteobacteria bacterium]|nr:UDP-N-acetylmuramate dehydrogenase [Deltaproteobacteria bacterium]